MSQAPTAMPTVMQVLPALGTGGVERAAVDMVAALTQAGFGAVVVSSGGRLVPEISARGGLHITAPAQSKNPARMARNARRLKRLIQEHGVSLVHARSRAPAWSALWAARRTGAPIVTTFHGTYGIGNPLKHYYNSVMARGDRVIAISGFIRDHIMEHYRPDPARVRMVPRGVDTAIFDPAAVDAARVDALGKAWGLPARGDKERPFVALLPGRLTAWKGQELMLAALARMERRTLCVLAGPNQGRDGYSRQLAQTARRLGVADQVVVPGDCHDLPAACLLADAVVSASTAPEAFGRVTAEGMAMSRPVVAPDHGGAAEQIAHGETGRLFRPGDADDLAQWLDHVAAMPPAARDAMGEKARRVVVDRFSRTRMCADTLSVYRELLNGGESR